MGGARVGGARGRGVKIEAGGGQERPAQEKAPKSGVFCQRRDAATGRVGGAAATLCRFCELQSAIHTRGIRIPPPVMHATLAKLLCSPSRLARHKQTLIINSQSSAAVPASKNFCKGIDLFRQVLMSDVCATGAESPLVPSTCRLRAFGCVPMRSKHLAVALPALVAGIHVLAPSLPSASGRTGGRGLPR